MLFTKESDYAIRIVRALRSGEQRNVQEICDEEEIPNAFCYKIMRKLNRGGIVEVVRGAKGGFRLTKSIREMTLYDVIMAVDPDFSVIQCIHNFCDQNSGSRRCKVHRELLGVQHTVEQLLQKKTLYDILEG